MAGNTQFHTIVWGQDTVRCVLSSWLSKVGVEECPVEFEACGTQNNAFIIENNLSVTFSQTTKNKNNPATTNWRRSLRSRRLPVFHHHKTPVVGEPLTIERQRQRLARGFRSHLTQSVTIVASICVKSATTGNYTPTSMHN